MSAKSTGWKDTSKRRPARRRIRVHHAKLGRWKAHGLQEGRNVYIDPRAKSSRSYLNTLLHEGLHVLFPDLPESTVKRAACSLTRAAWEQGFRRVQ